jgi:hypothetical protein
VLGSLEQSALEILYEIEATHPKRYRSPVKFVPLREIQRNREARQNSLREIDK